MREIAIILHRVPALLRDPLKNVPAGEKKSRIGKRMSRFAKRKCNKLVTSVTTVTRLQRGCSEIAAKLQRGCNEIATKFQRNCNEIATKLQRNCNEIAMKLQ